MAADRHFTRNLTYSCHDNEKFWSAKVREKGKSKKFKIQKCPCLCNRSLLTFSKAHAPLAEMGHRLAVYRHQLAQLYGQAVFRAKLQVLAVCLLQTIGRAFGLQGGRAAVAAAELQRAQVSPVPAQFLQFLIYGPSLTPLLCSMVQKYNTAGNAFTQAAYLCAAAGTFSNAHTWG
jgi:hypothetical protein